MACCMFKIKIWIKICVLQNHANIPKVLWELNKNRLLLFITTLHNISGTSNIQNNYEWHIQGQYQFLELKLSHVMSSAHAISA